MSAKYPSWEPGYRKAYTAKRYAENRETLIVKSREHYRKNKALIDARNKAYYERNKEAAIKRAERWRLNNPERAKELRRARYHAPDGKRKAKHWECYQRQVAAGKPAIYRERIRERHREWSRNRAANLTDNYVREILSKYSPISAKDWPQELVEVKKLELKIKRECGDGRTLAKPRKYK